MAKRETPRRSSRDDELERLIRDQQIDAGARSGRSDEASSPGFLTRDGAIRSDSALWLPVAPAPDELLTMPPEDADDDGVHAGEIDRIEPGVAPAPDGAGATAGRAPSARRRVRSKR